MSAHTQELRLVNSGGSANYILDGDQLPTGHSLIRSTPPPFYLAERRALTGMLAIECWCVREQRKGRGSERVCKSLRLHCNAVGSVGMWRVQLFAYAIKHLPFLFSINITFLAASLSASPLALLFGAKVCDGIHFQLRIYEVLHAPRFVLNVREGLSLLRCSGLQKRNKILTQKNLTIELPFSHFTAKYCSKIPH